MREFKFLTLLIFFAGIAGCAAHPDPIVDMKGVNPDRLATDWEECENYSEEI